MQKSAEIKEKSTLTPMGIVAVMKANVNVSTLFQ